MFVFGGVLVFSFWIFVWKHYNPCNLCNPCMCKMYTCYLLVSFYGHYKYQRETSCNIHENRWKISQFSMRGSWGCWLNISSNLSTCLWKSIYSCMVILLHGIECHCRVNPNMVMFPIGSMELEYLPQHLPTKSALNVVGNMFVKVYEFLPYHFSAIFQRNGISMRFVSTLRW